MSSIRWLRIHNKLETVGAFHAFYITLAQMETTHNRTKNLVFRVAKSKLILMPRDKINPIGFQPTGIAELGQ